MTDEIIFIASVLTALGVIIATAIKVYKFIRKWEKWVEEQSEHALDNYLSIKRLTIMSQEMPLSERISAGEKYIKYGGNGEVKHKYEELLTFLPSESKIK
ncbi:MAG: hypothetical protein UGF89_07610 [Acutalibacteraceae bacterium]|nr:hypothetical protein [Acutalibacteraceae bacterium]